ncbi:phosphatase PAP2 family protein [Erwiniaceae bacterium BAC15a-03b]|uniref:Phosphatase PAP2 family protein n=1 Tax=Winslowiella arboricola TaxID=2978220 RepID=A0A9J6PVM6_9GAMM|nr:phosphatase PAP2 family protein [Winslowiella arboricola]MCU5774974.1 phosphatase PAP2 family protein [Winslowiella arboricola]MCU5780571.1 phosphatase PAP2 family protein [Winslowiella arboricola]
MNLTSKLNKSTTCLPIKTNSIYLLPPRFYAIQFVLLAFFAVLFTWFSRSETLDMMLTRIWFDPITRQFPWKESLWLDVINHRLLKYLVIATGVMLLFKGLLRRQPQLILVALLIGVGSLAVGVLKASSAHSCPWDLVEFGGQAFSYPLFGQVPENSGPGRCFPGGHASSGFSLMALFFLFRPQRARLAWSCWSVAVLLGLLMGFGQVMRGAHFFSHNLWSGWWVWLVQLLTFGCVSYLLNRKRKIDNGNA